LLSNVKGIIVDMKWKKFEKFILTLDIVPNFFNFKILDDKRWYIRVWAEYEGFKYYAEQIQQYEQNVDQLEVEEKLSERKYLDKVKETENIKKEVENLEEQIGEYRRILSIIDKENFFH